MDTDKIIEFAPYILVVIMFIWQNNVFVRPEQLEKKHREIISDIKKDFVELNAYKEFQNHVLQEIAGLKQDIAQGFNEIKDTIQRKHEDA